MFFLLLYLQLSRLFFFNLNLVYVRRRSRFPTSFLIYLFNFLYLNIFIFLFYFLFNRWFPNLFRNLRIILFSYDLYYACIHIFLSKPFIFCYGILRKHKKSERKKENQFRHIFHDWINMVYKEYSFPILWFAKNDHLSYMISSVKLVESINRSLPMLLLLL